MAVSTETIFFPTDFSKNAQRALPFAAKIASLTGSRLVLFHTIHGMLDRPDFSQDKEKAIEDAGKRFDKIVAGIRKEKPYRELEISTILQSGTPVTGLLQKAGEYNAGLIVMGTKGATGNRNVIFGSIASNTILKSEIPVLAVPPGGSHADLKRITFTTDYHEGDFNALKQTIEFAELFNSSIEIIHVAEQRKLLADIKFRGFKDLVNEKIDYEDISFEQTYEYDFFPAMADYFVNNPNSLLVMIRYKKTFWEKLVEKNHTKEMAFYTKVPLLVLIGA